MGVSGEEGGVWMCLGGFEEVEEGHLCQGVLGKWSKEPGAARDLRCTCCWRKWNSGRSRAKEFFLIAAMGFWAAAKQVEKMWRKSYWVSSVR